ncbi:MAG: hypothetical protein ACMXYF_05795, partial [Candidatus Woesearchaeota archaeon]
MSKANASAALLVVAAIFATGVLFTQYGVFTPDVDSMAAFESESQVAITRGLHTGLSEFAINNMVYGPDNKTPIALYCNEEQFPTHNQLENSFTLYVQETLDEYFRLLQVRDSSITHISEPNISLMNLEDDRIQVDIADLRVRMRTGDTVQEINISREEYIPYRFGYIFNAIKRWSLDDYPQNPLQLMFTELFDVMNRPCHGYLCTCISIAGQTELISEERINQTMFLHENHIEQASQTIAQHLNDVVFYSSGVECSVEPELETTVINNTYVRKMRATNHCVAVNRDLRTIPPIPSGSWNDVKDTVSFAPSSTDFASVCNPVFAPLGYDPQVLNLSKKGVSPLMEFNRSSGVDLPETNAQGSSINAAAISDQVAVSSSYTGDLLVSCVDTTASIESASGLSPFEVSFRFGFSVARTCDLIDDYEETPNMCPNFDEIELGGGVCQDIHGFISTCVGLGESLSDCTDLVQIICGILAEASDLPPNEAILPPEDGGGNGAAAGGGGGNGAAAGG